MILDRLENADHYLAVHPGFAPAFDFLRRTDFEKLTPGKHEVQGDALFVLLNPDPGRGKDKAVLEAHQKYIDIQYTVVGIEEIGWRPLSSCEHIIKPFDAERDIAFYSDAPESWFAVPAGTFAIFNPEDAHAPLAAPVGAKLLKAVMKVAVEWE